MTRAEKVAEIQRLRAEGLKLREIGERVGLATSTVHAYLTDSTGEKERARKDSYRRPCVDCATMTSGARCVPCARVVAGAERKVWTREKLLDAIRAWADLYGEPPAVPDWDSWHARHVLHDEQRAQRVEDADGQWPSAITAIREFGSWSGALQAAGFEPRVPHGGGENVARRRSAKRVAA